MITLNTDRGLIRLENFNDVFEIPGFTVDVDPKESKLESIIGNYQEKDLVRCGLSSCHTKHGKGYLVKVEDGTVTNIGKDCGKTHFGVDFESMSRQMDRDIEYKERRENLKAFQSLIPDYQENVNDLRTQESGADWLYGNIKKLTTPGKDVPDSVVEITRKVRLTRNPELTRPRFATSEEVKQIEVAERRKIEGPYYIDEPVGRLQGIAALYPENDLRDLLVLGLEKLFKELEELDVDSLTSPQLRANINRATSADSQLRQAQNAIAEGRRLLQAENLLQLMQFTEDQDEERLFANFLKALNA